MIIEKKSIKTVAFLSNYFNHHQKPFCDAMYKKLGEKNFVFVETSVMSKERRKLGYGMDGYPSYVIPYQVVRSSVDAIKDLADRADAVIIGAAPDLLIEKRLKNNKLIFRYSERPLKKGLELHKYIPRFIRWHKSSPMSKKLYMLCASSYTASDYAKFGMFKNRCYKWGYFTELKEYENVDALIRGKKKNSILWVARFIDWKHPELAIKVVEKLRQDGYDFELNMIGDGIMLDEIKQMISNLGLEENVHILGSMSPENVRKHMEESEIFMLTSNRMEGWGLCLMSQ